MTRLLRQRVAAYCAILALTAFFVGLYAVIAANVEDFSTDRIRSITNHTANLLEDWLGTYKQSAALAASLGQTTLNRQNAIQKFSSLAPQTELEKNVVFQIDGKGLFFVEEKAFTPASPSEKNYTRWSQLLSLPIETSHIGGPVPSLSGEGDELLVIHPLVAGDGQRFGSLALRIPLSLLTEQVHNLAALGSFGRQVLIISSTGELLAPTDAVGTTRRLQDDPNLAPLESFLKSPASTGDHITLGKNDYFICYNKIAGTNWHVVLTSSTVYGLRILSMLRYGLFLAWVSLTLFVLFLFRQVRKYDHYKVLSELDHLTGAGNRLAFEKALDRLNLAQKFPVSLLMMDVDGLKVMNDTLGHEAGDALLRRVTLLLQRSLRDNDTIYRIGGDEFAVIIPGMSHNSALPLVERINKNAAASREKTTLPPIYISHGLADALNSQELVTLYRRADETMYTNKNKGRKVASEELQKWLAANPKTMERRQRA